MFMLSRRRQTDFCGSARCRASVVGPRYVVRTLEVCLFFALACSCSAAHAQILQGYHHTAWTTENGFSAV